MTAAASSLTERTFWGAAFGAVLAAAAGAVGAGAEGTGAGVAAGSDEGGVYEGRTAVSVPE